MCAQKSNNQKAESKSSNEANPFSFKTYLQNPAFPEIIHNQETNTEDNLQFSIDNSKPVPPKENPFSFKNFLTSDTNLPNADDLPDLSLSPTKIQSNLDIVLPPELVQDLVPDLDWSADIEKSTPANKFLIDDESLSESVIDNQSVSNSALIDRLKNELSEDKRVIAKQKEKIDKLEKRLKSLLDKEENENKTLELVVQQVEKNLEEATKRAIGSESTVELLKIEIVQLKGQLKALSNENLLLKSANLNLGRNLFITINDIANEINEAALSAENSLTYLNKGVSTLRLIASRLQSLEKISEIID